MSDDDRDSINGRLSSVETKIDILFEEFRTHRKTTEEFLADLRLVVAALTTSVQGQTVELTGFKAPMLILVQDSAQFKNDLRALREAVAEMKPDVKDYTERRAEAVGAARFGRFVWAAVVGIASMISGLVAFMATKLFENK